MFLMFASMFLFINLFSITLSRSMTFWRSTAQLLHFAECEIARFTVNRENKENADAGNGNGVSGECKGGCLVERANCEQCRLFEDQHSRAVLERAENNINRNNSLARVQKRSKMTPHTAHKRQRVLRAPSRTLSSTQRRRFAVDHTLDSVDFDSSDSDGGNKCCFGASNVFDVRRARKTNKPKKQ